ncbi:MAG TPA: hypothetical protein DD490_07000, partial [Acidobacteria bacterium]|nr:hypothetical protein [Acidobacteriota bacterium]
MNKTAWTLAATAALLWTTALRADDGDVVVRHFVKQFPASGIERVFVDVPVGDVVIEGSTAAQVELEVNLECADRGGSCEELAQRVKVVFSRDEGELTLRVKEWPKSTNRGLEAHIRVLMPRQIDLRADLGVGRLSIAGLESDVTADLGVGQLNVTLPLAAIASVSADAGIGDAGL